MGGSNTPTSEYGRGGSDTPHKENAILKGGSKALDNNTLLFLQYHIYKKKLQDDSLLLQDFVSQIKYKYSLEKL